MINAGAVIDRMKEAAGVRTNDELAGLLGLRSGAVSNWRTRNSIPLDQLVEYAAQRGVSLDWLILGQGDRTLRAPSAPPSELIVDDLLDLALETAAREHALATPGGVMTVSELVRPALGHYDKYYRLCEDFVLRGGGNTRELFVSIIAQSVPFVSWVLLRAGPGEDK